jgi:hypothetical protein
MVAVLFCRDLCIGEFAREKEAEGFLTVYSRYNWAALISKQCVRPENASQKKREPKTGKTRFAIWTAPKGDMTAAAMTAPYFVGRVIVTLLSR